MVRRFFSGNFGGSAYLCDPIISTRHGVFVRNRRLVISFEKFLGIFAVTQIPLAISEEF